LRGAGLHEIGTTTLRAGLQFEFGAAQFDATVDGAPVCHGLNWHKTMMLQSLPLPLAAQPSGIAALQQPAAERPCIH
jgi:hypothetical protein